MTCRPSPRGSRARTGAILSLLVVLASLLTGLDTPVTAAADDDPDLAVRIDSLKPAVLRPTSDVTLTGTVTNHDDHAWTSAQAYLVIARTPYTSRDDLADVIAANGSYTGTRIVQPLDAIGEIGTLRPGDTGRFTLKVPHESLGLVPGTGVHPVGVQILATDTDGSRSTTAVARATTFLPSVADGTSLPSTPTGLVWPFLMPDRRGEGGAYTDPTGLAASVTSGQLRHLLDLAVSTPAAGSTIVLDPALIRGLDDLVAGRHLGSGVRLDDAQRSAVRLFRDDLVAAARSRATWVLGFDRPDVLGIAAAPVGRTDLETAVERATTAVVRPLGITGRRVTWPTSTGVTQSLLSFVRGRGASPVVVTGRAARDWSSTQGSVVLRRTADGTVPLLVSSDLDTGVPGTPTVATLRQRLLAEATLGSLSSVDDPDSRADAVSLVDPTWDPGAVTGEPLAAAFSASFARASSTEDLLASDPVDYKGRFPTSSTVTTVGATQTEALSNALREYGVLDDLVDDDSALRERQAIDVAGLLGTRWRKLAAEGTTRALRLAGRATSDVDGIQVKGPPAFTLSSSQASFPLTISNDTDHAISVGVRIDSTNPALTVPGLDPVDVGPSERITVNVPIDVGNQSASTLSARLVTPSGRAFGDPAVFNVRSSSVGLAVWIAMGAAGALVVAAIVRRIVRRRRAGKVATDE